MNDVVLDWWRERFTTEEIVELARGMWGHVEPSVDGVVNTNLRTILAAAAEQQVTFPDH